MTTPSKIASHAEHVHPETVGRADEHGSPHPILHAIRRLLRSGLQGRRYVFVLYGALATLLFERTWRSPNTLNVGSGGDPMLGMWDLRWTPYALTHLRGPFLTDLINYPFGVNLMWNSPIFLPSLILWPVTAGLGPIVAYNTLSTLNIALSASSAYVACRMFVNSRVAAFGGGLVYGFSPYMMAQGRDHAILTAAFVPPLLLLVLYEMLVVQRRSPRHAGIAFGLLAAAQLLIAEEVLASEGIVAVLAIVTAIALKPRTVRSRVSHALTGGGVALVVFAIASAYPLIIQFLGPNGVHGTVQRPSFFVSDLTNFFVPTRMQQMAPAWALASSNRWTGNLSEFDAYLGFPLLIVMIFVAVRWWHRPSIRVGSVVAMVVAMLSLGPSLHVNGRDTGIWLPWRLFEAVPLLSNILPARLPLYVDLVAALFVAVFIDHLVRSRSLSRRSAGAVALLAVAATVFPVFPYPANPVVVPRFFTDGSARVIPIGSIALIAPFQQLYPAEPMLWQAETGMRFRMPQGYFIGPDQHGRPAYGAPYSTLSVTMLNIQAGQEAPPTEGLRTRVLRDLALRKVGTVIIGPVNNEAGMIQFFEFVFRQTPEMMSDVYLWRDVASLVKAAQG